MKLYEVTATLTFGTQVYSVHACILVNACEELYNITTKNGTDNLKTALASAGAKALRY